MSELLERIYGIIFQPVATLRGISCERPLPQSALVLIAVTMFTTWTGYFTIWSNSMFVFAAIVVTLALWFISSAIGHLVAELFGGNGQAKGLLAANGYTQVPRIFSVPLLVLIAFLPEAMQAGMIILTAAVIFCWEIILGVIAIRETYGFSTGRAFLTLVAPYVAMLLPVLALIIVLAKIYMQMMSYTGPEVF